MKTLGFFGDSFCSKEVNQHCIEQGYDTYITQIKNHYSSEIVHLGMGGSSVWDLYLNQLKPFIVSGNLPDVSVFTWSHPGRLYHKIARSLHYSSAMAGHNKEKEKEYKKNFPGKPNFFDKKVWDAAKEFYLHLYDSEKEEVEYVAFLQYLDNNVFSIWPSDKKIIHLWSFANYAFDGKAYNIDEVRYAHRWKNGVEIRPPLMWLSAREKWPHYSTPDIRPNHISGQESNQIITKCVIHGIDNYVSGNLLNMNKQS